MLGRHLNAEPEAEALQEALSVYERAMQEGSKSGSSAWSGSEGVVLGDVVV